MFDRLLKISRDLCNKKGFIHIFHLFVAVGPLIMAYLAEYYYDVLPCMLCVMQRFVFFAIIFFAILGVFFHKKFFAFINTMLFLLCGSIAFYNTGLERGWIVDKNTFCAGHNNIFSRLFMKYEIPCNMPAMKMFGFSLAEINIFYCVLIAGLTIYIMNHCGQQDRKQ